MHGSLASESDDQLLGKHILWDKHQCILIQCNVTVVFTSPRNTCLFPGFEVLASLAMIPSSLLSLPLSPSPPAQTAMSSAFVPTGIPRERGRRREGGREALTSEQKIYSPAPQCPSDIGAKKGCSARQEGLPGLQGSGYENIL